MIKVTLIGSENNQVMRFVLNENRKKIDVILRYKEQVQGWFISFTYENFSINNHRIVTGGNFLHQFRNILPFGMLCEVEGEQEPMLVEDFSSNRASLYVLTGAEVQAYSEVVSGQTTA